MPGGTTTGPGIAVLAYAAFAAVVPIATTLMAQTDTASAESLFDGMSVMQLAISGAAGGSLVGILIEATLIESKVFTHRLTFLRMMTKIVVSPIFSLWATDAIISRSYLDYSPSSVIFVSGICGACGVGLVLMCVPIFAPAIQGLIEYAASVLTRKGKKKLDDIGGPDDA